MSVLNRLKKGAKYIAMAFETETMTDAMLKAIISDYKASQKRWWMLAGDRYYAVDNDYANEEKPYKRWYQADHRLIHATYKNIIDEKIGYIFSKPATIVADDEKVTQAVVEALGDDIYYTLETLGLEASNKGIAWLHPYIQDGRLCFFVPPSEQMIPEWTDATHTKLKRMIRVYTESVWRFGRRVQVERVCVYEPEGMRSYRLDNGNLLKLSEEDYLTVDGAAESWGQVPWIAFKNNRKEICDLKFVKSLVDSYDMTRSEVANYIEEVKNLILILRGYSGDTLDEFLETIYKHRAIVLDAEEDGAKSGVEALTPKMDIQASKEHYEQLKRDILESGQAVNRNLDKFGSAPSGIALQFLFSGLELKSNQMESEFRRGFSDLMDYVFRYLGLMKKSIEECPISITFNHDMKMDEQAIIENCNASRGLISTDTILANHPWVEDVQIEKEKLKDETERIYNPVTGAEDA